MSYLDLDGMIARLQQMKEEGVPGNTPVFRPSRDNNGKGGFLERIEMVAMSPVAKADIDKGYSLCKTVSARGVPVVNIY